MNKLELLFESSSLREDLLKDIKESLLDLFKNIELTDELCARVGAKTYELIKEIKNDL